LLQARRWVTELVHWYNDEHRHSAVGFVTPSQRHSGQDRTLLEDRATVYEQARQANPLRWSGNARDWSRVELVNLNPDKVKTKDAEPLKKAA
jgi:putative transposase